MPSSETIELRETASHLLGVSVNALKPIAGGGNNRIYRVSSDAGEFVLKHYMRAAPGERDRLDSEHAALSLFAEHGVENVPRSVAVDVETGAAIHSFIEGKKVEMPDSEDIDRALDFVQRLEHLKTTETAIGIGEAAEACFSAEAIVDQVVRRLRVYRTVEDDTLRSFLCGRFEPALSWISADAERALDALGLAMDERLPQADYTLSPSDFGFHNTLRTADGSLTFVDFEYFGWDDPVKLVADFMLHPGMALSPGLAQRFCSGAKTIFADRSNFAARFDAVLPLYGLRWCMIVLNAFDPARWSRISFATGEDRQSVLTRQMAKAVAMLERFDA